MMKLILFGLGSIGTRHANILKKRKNVELYAFRSGQSKRINNLGIKEVHSFADIKKLNCDVAFITNPTYLHIPTTLKCAELGMKLFIEKPIGSSLKDLTQLIKKVKQKKLVSYVAYNLRFHPVIDYLKTYLRNKKIYHVSVFASSYLMDWRHVKNNKDSYSASRRMGGGVILDLSHEFDYIDYLLDGIKTIKGNFKKVSDLTKDAEDYVDALIECKKTEVNLHMDFISRRRQRSINIVLENETIHADLLESSIEFHRKNQTKHKKFKQKIPDTYSMQMDYFFKNINNRRMMNNLQEASILYKKIIAFRKKKQ